ncbi:MAG: LysR family transcriptional regulator [Anaeromyxobacteraceae bacterium]
MRHDIELRQLRALLSIVEEGGFVRASRVLRLSQSTVSAAIRALERRVGGAVLRKTGGKVALTAIGEALFPYARQMLALDSELRARLGEVTRDFANQVLLATSESISSYLLPAHLVGLRRRWPRSRVQVTAATCLEVRSALRAGRVDLGLVCEPVALTGSEAMMVVAPAELALFATPRHPLAGAEATPERLRGYPVQLSDAAGSFKGELTRYFEAAGLPTPPVIATGSVEGVKRGVLADAVCLGLLPSFAIEEELRAGRVLRLAPSPPLPAVVIKALWRQDYALSPMSSELLERIREGGPRTRSSPRRSGAGRP